MPCSVTSKTSFKPELRWAMKPFRLAPSTAHWFLPKLFSYLDRTSKYCFWPPRSQSDRWRLYYNRRTLVHPFRSQFLNPFLENIHLGEWNQQVAIKTRNCSVLCLISTVVLTRFQSSIWAGLSGCAHLPVGLPFTVPLSNGYWPSNPKPYFRADWSRPSTLIWIFDWDIFSNNKSTSGHWQAIFQAAQVPRRQHSSKTQNMFPKRSYRDRPNCKFTEMLATHYEDQRFLVSSANKFSKSNYGSINNVYFLTSERHAQSKAKCVQRWHNGDTENK